MPMRRLVPVRYRRENYAELIMFLIAQTALRTYDAVNAELP